MGRQHVYNHSSSSDSDSESCPTPRRRRHQKRRPKRSHVQASQTAAPAPSAHSDTAADGTKRKNKKDAKRPAQESINSIWAKFSQKKFSKALAVLPFAPVAASCSDERGNELLQAGYERAAEECRRKVRKIITECRRVNTRYRDPGWDLDWDLKWGKGHTLNSLTETTFDICHKTLLDPEARVPKAVKRVHDIFENPTFLGKILPGDIKQGILGDCWFVASLTGLANVPGGVKRICVEYDTKIGIYGFVFHRDGQWIQSIIDDKLFLKSPCWNSYSLQREMLQHIDREDAECVYRKTYQTGSQALTFAKNKDLNETWVPLVEKAYAKAHGDYASLGGGWIGEALEDLSGGVTTELLASDIFDVDAFWRNELSKVNQEFLFGCSTGLLGIGYGARDGITEGHAYVIMDARELKDGTRLCKLRNPWGTIRKGNWEGAWSDGSKEWTAEAQEELDHTFGSDSVFWIPYEDLLRKYLHFDRTRLFRDPDWRSCQRWIGVEVPWKPQYHEKFHIKLTKESPVVLVLSQLDKRYFRGLEGQYSFRLQFRLHEEGRPGTEEYIVRSHGNYLMNRSVSIDLPTLSSGSYAVYISISAERDTALPSTEDVVRSECEGREENEKLAQVGQAYDLAHAKAAPHLDRLLKIRKNAESTKASEARKKKRRKKWEKRQIGRAIDKKQDDKDAAKKAEAKRCKRAKAEVKAEEAAQKEAAQKEAAQKEAAAAAERSRFPPTDKAVQTEPDTCQKEDSRDEVDVDTASTTSASSGSTSTPQYTPQSSPGNQCSTHFEGDKIKIVVPPAQGLAVGAFDGPPPPPAIPQIPSPAVPLPSIQFDAQKPLELKLHYCACSACKPPAKVEESDGYSSDSPVEDYEQLYDEDDINPKRWAAASDTDEDSEDEDKPDPWNAIAVVGFTVYSKDENLELKVVVEGGKLEQDGMGSLGEADLDNAVANAAGQREEKKEPSRESGVSVNGEGQTETKLSSDEAAGCKVSGLDNAGEHACKDTERVGEAKTGHPADEALVKDAMLRQHQSVGQHPARIQDLRIQDSHDAPTQSVQTISLNSEMPVEDITKAVLLMRSRIQTNCRKLLAQDQQPMNGDVQEVSDCLAKLESYPDLEASVILSTKIHKVMMAILKLDCLPKDDGLKASLGARAQALLDDYELTLMT
ncbi:unnamed protein product [Discula destructiva]